MTKRSDIEPTQGGWRAVSYTRRCGWVDWGHALPRNATRLLRQIWSEQAQIGALSRVDVTFENERAYLLTFGEDMTKLGLSATSEHHWVVKKGLPRQARESVALGIFLVASHEFETLQSSSPYSWFTPSGFSGEDLVSDLIGFYAALRHIPLVRMRQICGEVSVAESYRIWDKHLPNGLGGLKNRTFRPILFPTKEGVRSGADTVFPVELTTVRPSAEGDGWVRPEGGFVPQRLIDLRARIAVSRMGHVNAAQPGTIAIPLRARH